MGSTCGKSAEGSEEEKETNRRVMGNKDSKQEYGVSDSADAGGSKSKRQEKSVPLPPETESKDVNKVLCDYDDMKDGEMKEVTVEGHNVLLARDQGAYYAVSPKCTHYGASLAKGALCNGRVRCPWHGACFDLATGDIEDFPGLDSLQSYEVEVDDGKVTINTDTVALSSTKRVKKMITRDQECTLLYLIVGGGGAALECAETLRQGGYKGKILIVTKEECPPYDRPKLSKSLTSSGEDLALRTAEFYSVYDIDIMTGMEAFKLIPDMKHMMFKGEHNGEEFTDYLVEFDQCMIATGGQPNKLKMPSAARFPEQVLYVRTPADTNAIADKGKGRHVVIMGTSFIGMEIAAYFAGKVKSVTVIGRGGRIPLAKCFGDKIGGILKKMFDDKGVKFILDSSIKEFQGEDCKLINILMENGESLPADICVVGIGVNPTTSYLADSGMKLDSNGFIVVDKYMRTSCEFVFAAGDITSFPLIFNDNEMTNVGHWQMAMAQGRNAAQNMLFQEEPFKSVPYFWSTLFGKSVRVAGHLDSSIEYDEVIFHGDDKRFLSYYIREEQVKAVASMNWDPIVSMAAELMHASISIPVTAIREDPEGLMKLVPNC